MKIIAITQRIQKIEKYKEFRDQLDIRLNYLVTKLGYLPVPIPNFKNYQNNLNLKNWLKRIKPAGIILSGGDNIGIYKFRDQNELSIVKWSLIKKIPVLGICRGMQIINKYFGGSKVRIKNHVGKRHRIIGDHAKFRKSVNSFHNWGFYPKNISKVLRIQTVSNDKSIEAIRHKKYPIYGIMWHPEREPLLKKDDLILIKKIFQ